MAAASASYFSGTALMPSQHAGAFAADHSATAAAPSPSKPRDPRFSGCVPATVLHIARSFAAAAAADGGGDPVFSIDGVETSNVKVLGRVVSIANRENGVVFTIDDGTGKIPLVRWITEQSDTRETDYIQDGVYLKVYVNLMGFQSKKQGLARSIRPVTNFNEVVLHFIECMHVHLENVQSQIQGQLPPAVQTNTYTHMPFSGGMGEHQVHFTQVNQGQFPPAVQTNTSTHVPFSGGVREHQVHFAPQVNQGQFPSAVQTNTSTHVPFSGGAREHHFAPQVNQGQFPSAVQTNMSTRMPFSDGVREHHQVHFAPQVNQGQFPPAVQTNTFTHVPFSGGVIQHQVHLPQVNQRQFRPPIQTNTSTHVPFSGGAREQVHFNQPNQFSGYSDTGGQQHDMQRMILEVMQQPDILALEQGVHVDDVARRMGMTRANIAGVIKYLTDEGYLYWTIDDSHVRSNV